jgi:hypothetical protein
VEYVASGGVYALSYLPGGKTLDEMNNSRASRYFAPSVFLYSGKAIKINGVGTNIVG